MKMRVRLLCLFALLPFATGCDELAKAVDNKKADEKSKTQSLASDNSKPPKKSSAELPELPANDPLVAHTVEASQQVSQLEEEILAKLDELRSTLASAKVDPSRLRQSVDQFVELTKDMQQKSAATEATLDALSQKTAALSRSSRHLGSSYRAVAELYRKKARDYSEIKLREQLLAFAKDFDESAAKMPERSKSLDAVHKKLPALKRKVQEMNEFCTVTIDYLNSHPAIGPETRDRYSTEFKSFAVTFTEWIRVLDELRSTIRERAISKVIQESHRKELLAQKQIQLAKRVEEMRLEQAKKDELMESENAKRAEQACVTIQAEQTKREEQTRRPSVTEIRQPATTQSSDTRRLVSLPAPRHELIPVLYSQPAPTVIHYPPVYSQQIVFPPHQSCDCVRWVTISRWYSW